MQWVVLDPGSQLRPRKFWGRACLPSHLNRAVVCKDFLNHSSPLVDWVAMALNDHLLPRSPPPYIHRPGFALWDLRLIYFSSMDDPGDKVRILSFPRAAANPLPGQADWFVISPS